MDVCADGFDDFERQLVESDVLDQQSKTALSQVLSQTYNMTLESLNVAAANFERYEQLTSLAVPPELFIEQPMPAATSLEPIDPKQEAHLDQELAELREQVLQARLACRQLKQQLNMVDKDLSRAASAAAAYKPLIDAISTSSQSVLQEAAVIQQLASKLQPSIARAQQLQAEQQQQKEPIGQIPASTADAAAGPLEPFADVSNTAKGGSYTETTDIGSHKVAAERHVRQFIMETGASLKQLQATNAALQGN
eukprot:GHRR01024853.1.p1 GENE.GHRR01024853.1~~GHRR01024853.1.p1  ORF type:complete len:252 (+),score=131.39 GHRR01024853.1:448-1203(+)